MLNDEFFNPLDLDEALDEAYEAGGLDAVIALLAQAVDDPRAADDPELIGYLDELAEQYAELERYAEAIATAHRIIDLDPDQRVDELIWIAGLHARDGDLTAARTILNDLRSDHEAVSDASRDLWQGLSAAVVLGDDVGDHLEAADWLADDIRTGIRVQADPDLIRALDTHRLRISRLATPPLADPPLDREIQAYTGGTPADLPRPAHRRPRGQTRRGYLPPTEFAKARSTFPSLPSHHDHRREIELSLRALPPGSQRVVDLTADGLTTYAKTHATDPTTPETQAAYADTLDTPGTLWPPDRNDPCWCGSGAKYKKCCRTL